MVGVKGKSGRHKKDCSCEKCSKKKELKKEVEFFTDDEKALEQEEPKGL